MDDQRTRWVETHAVANENEELRSWELAHMGGEVHMFGDDVQKGILPYSMKDGMRIELAPADQDGERLVGQALGRDRFFGNGYQYHRFAEAVPEFVRECAQTIMHSGTAQYEIVTERDRETEKPIGFRLQWVTPHTIQRRRGEWVQDIGTKAAEEFGLGRFVPVDISRIVTFPIIPPLTARKLLSLNRTLAGVGTQLIPVFGVNPAESPAGFDFEDFQLKRSRASAAATALIGWNARGRYAEEVTDYYYLHREIRFQRFLVQLRSSIIERVNGVLAKMLPRFGCSGSIVLSGFPGLPEIDKIARNLELGTGLKAAFEDIVKI